MFDMYFDMYSVLLDTSVNNIYNSVAYETKQFKIIK